MLFDAVVSKLYISVIPRETIHPQAIYQFAVTVLGVVLCGLKSVARHSGQWASITNICGGDTHVVDSQIWNCFTVEGYYNFYIKYTIITI